MKVLMINKFYYDFGGAESYMFGLTDLLKKKGIEVIPFSMRHPKNYETSFADYFVRNISFDTNENIFSKSISTIYSIEARQKIKKLIIDFKPDIAHIHNFNFLITPSILFELKKHNIPVIQTLHDPQIICPFHRLYNYEKKSICEKCKNGKFYNSVFTKCIKNSYSKSLIGMLESYIYHTLNTYESKIDIYISPSQFLKNKINDFGYNNFRIEVIPNYFDNSMLNDNISYEKFGLYIGRLSEEKGIKTLIDAIRNNENYNMKIVGDGPLKEELKYIFEEMPNLEYLGHRSRNEVKELLGRCLFTVVPSTWYENCPMSIIESLGNSKAVVASQLGGNVELIENQKTGLLFKVGDSGDLYDKMAQLFDNRNYAIKLGQMAAIASNKKHSAENHVNTIKEIYSELLRNRKSK